MTLEPSAAVEVSAHRGDGLSVEMADGRLVIAIGIDSLMTAVRGGDFWDDDELKIVSADEFAADIVSELEREREDGTTPVHLMIDAAAEEAVEQGSLGVETKADEEIVYDRDGPR